MIVSVLTGAVMLGMAFNLKSGTSTDYDIFFEKDINATKGPPIPRMFTQSRYRVLHSSSEATKVLDIDGDISLKLMDGKIKVQGAGEYFKGSFNRDQSVELLITVDYETQTETFPSYTKQNPDWRKESPETVGTHYIRSITYGGQLVISYRLEATSSEYMEDIIASVTANLAMSGSLSGDIKGNFEKLHSEIKGKADTIIDVFATTGLPPDPIQTIDQVFNAVDKYPEWVLKSTNGIGAPLKVEIVDLSTLNTDYKEYFKNYALDSMLNDGINKYSDIKYASKAFNKWIKSGKIFTPEQYKLINAFNKRLGDVEEAFNTAILKLDATKGSDQFDEAFKVYGEGEDNIPNRYSREFEMLRHNVEGKAFVWFPFTKAVTHYIHWGTKTCSAPSAQPVYTGFAASSSTKDKDGGSGGSYLCLPGKEASVVGDKVKDGTDLSYINGVQYKSVHQKSGQILCAFCKLENATSVFTIPGRTSCPSETKLEYSGYVMTAVDAGVAQNLVCLDKKPESSDSETPDDISSTLVPVWMECPECDEEERERYVGCVVCSR